MQLSFFGETNGKKSLQRKTLFANFQLQNIMKGIFGHKLAVSVENICQILEGKQKNKQTKIPHKHLLHFHTVEKVSQRHLEWSSLHCTSEQKLISQKTKKMMVQKPVAMGYIFFIFSSNTQEEEEENCRESQYLQIYTANNSTPLTFILIIDQIVVEVCDEFTL